ncbi:DUF6172 family protein [Moritella sp. F3]|uniref:DUF6172 family protein n=1 Tax=Moritella sp. F3 TaxID=2718882 RepID=UPI0018E14E48|nr:DUF6172 family protein [Moritella sp. F3]GIC75492.1 hypothetical protein FMO001_02190 [Moritella sp. F1]GIC80637.1 hypothetical protein FMO003_09180 [Moritella sp. F3]
MKKTFVLNHPKIIPARQVEAIKSEIRKYIKRERKKTLPKGVDYWDFDCKYGATEQEAQVIHLSEINKSIDSGDLNKDASFYIEILVKDGIRVINEEDEDLDYGEE